MLLSILCSPGHVVEEDRIALPLGEATFVSQVLRIGIADAENLDGDETLLKLAQALFGILDVQALHEALCEVLLRLHPAALRSACTWLGHTEKVD